jgi:hypothetical protein
VAIHWKCNYPAVGSCVVWRWINTHGDDWGFRSFLALVYMFFWSRRRMTVPMFSNLQCFF